MLSIFTLFLLWRIWMAVELGAQKKAELKKVATHMIAYRAHVEFIMSAYASDTTTQTKTERFCSIYRKVLLHSYICSTLFVRKPKHDVVLSCWCFVQFSHCKTVTFRLECSVASGSIFYLCAIKKNLYILASYVNRSNSACVVIVFVLFLFACVRRLFVFA